MTASRTLFGVPSFDPESLFISTFRKESTDEIAYLDPLNVYKDRISAIFDTYISWWKLSIFGHHHNKRAEEIKAQILNADNLDEISTILERQKKLIEGTAAQDPTPVPPGLEYRWNHPTALKNTTLEPNKSGYYKIITASIEAVNSIRIDETVNIMSMK